MKPATRRLLRNRPLVVVVVGAVALALAGCAGGGGTAPSADAEEIAFPEQDITVIVPFSAGGGTGVAAEAMAAAMNKQDAMNGHKVILEYVPGAGGATGARQVAESDPDGYTLVFQSLGSHVTVPLLEDVGYTPDDFAPLASIADSPSEIIVADDSPLKTPDDLVAAGKDHALTFGVAGAGTSAHFAAIMMAEELGIEIRVVPFDGSAEVVPAVAGGHVDVGAGSGAGEGLRTLAVSGNERMTSQPDAPTFVESGYDVVFYTWRSLFAPVDTPEDVLQKLESMIKTAVEDPDYVDIVGADNGVDPEFMGRDDLAERVAADWERFGPIAEQIRNAG